MAHLDDFSPIRDRGPFSGQRAQPAGAKMGDHVARRTIQYDSLTVLERIAKLHSFTTIPDKEI